MVEPLRMLLGKDRIRRRVIVDHINDALHPLLMYGLHNGLEILHCAIFRIDLPVIAYCIGRPQTPLPGHFADWMDRSEPHNINSQVMNPWKLRCDSLESAFLAEVSDKNLVHYFVSEFFTGFSRHSFLPYYCSGVADPYARTGTPFSSNSVVYFTLNIILAAVNGITASRLPIPAASCLCHSLYISA